MLTARVIDLDDRPGLTTTDRPADRVADGAIEQPWGEPFGDLQAGVEETDRQGKVDPRPVGIVDLDPERALAAESGVDAVSSRSRLTTSLSFLAPSLPLFLSCLTILPGSILNSRFIAISDARLVDEGGSA